MQYDNTYTVELRDWPMAQGRGRAEMNYNCDVSKAKETNENMNGEEGIQKMVGECGNLSVITSKQSHGPGM